MVDKENNRVQLHYCTAAGRSCYLIELLFLLHFALHLIVDAFGEEWLETGCRNHVLQAFLIQSGVNTTRVEPAVAHSYLIVRVTDGQLMLSFHSVPSQQTNLYDTSKKKKKSKQRL